MASLASLPPWKAAQAPEHGWTVTLGNGDWTEADDLDAALTAAQTMTDDAVNEGASLLLTRQAITLYRDGMRHGIGTMLAREGFLKNPLQIQRTEDA